VDIMELLASAGLSAMFGAARRTLRHLPGLTPDLEPRPLSQEELPDADEHIRQLHVPFPAGKTWTPHGSFDRYPLWPIAGSRATLRRAHWTAWYRFGGAIRERLPVSHEPAFWELFVCKGELLMRLSGHRTFSVEAGDYFCGVFTEDELIDTQCSDDALLIVKRRPAPSRGLEPQLRPSDRQRFLPYPYRHRDLDDFRAVLLWGSPFSRTGMTALVRFPVGTEVSSHYHDGQIFHELIYLRGGHLTPDGLYTIGDHVTSLPGCKVGPWLATQQRSMTVLPTGWPRYQRFEPAGRPSLPPWQPPPAWRSNDDVYGLLFVHGGPFLHRTGKVNWHRLWPHALGPRG
jgi:hypothetical protein